LGKKEGKEEVLEAYASKLRESKKKNVDPSSPA
jgi:hypothetical protein